MRTVEEYLRESFGENEIAKVNSIYPDAKQRTYIYQAIKKAVSEACQEQREICACELDDPYYAGNVLNAPEPDLA